MKSHVRFSVIGLFAFVLCGCVSVSNFKGISLAGNTVFVAGVPPIMQDDHYSCGAACVAAVAGYWGISLEEFKSKYPEMPDEATGHQLETMAQTLGLHAFAFRGSPDDLTTNLGNGRPMIVMIPKLSDPSIQGAGMLSTALLRIWNEYGPKPSHWVIAIGISQNREVIIHDPSVGLLAIKRDRFETWWAKKNNACLLIAAQ